MIQFPITISSNGTSSVLRTSVEQYAQRIVTRLNTQIGLTGFNRTYGSNMERVKGKSNIAEITQIVNTEVRNVIEQIGNLTISPSPVNPNLGVKIKQKPSGTLEVTIIAMTLNSFQEVVAVTNVQLRPI